MSTYVIFDAENPPAAPPRYAEGVMGYLGGARAARVWTLANWLAFRDIRQFPVYVPDIGADPAQQGIEAAELAIGLGWSNKEKGAAQRAIFIDMETSADAAWYDTIASTIALRGFMPVAYGSLSTVLANAADDVLAADWNDQVAIPKGQTLHGHQYVANAAFGGTVVDYSTIDGWLYQRGGVGPRHTGAH